MKDRHYSDTIINWPNFDQIISLCLVHSWLFC